MMSKIIIEEQAAPSAPGTNLVSIYQKSDKITYALDDTGVERVMAKRFEPIVPTQALPSANSVSVNNLPQIYSSLLVSLAGCSMDTTARRPVIYVNGFTTNYAGYFVSSVAGFVLTGAISLAHTLITSAQACNLATVISGYQNGSYPIATFNSLAADTGGGFAAYLGSTQSVTSLQIAVNSTGNFNGGTYSVYGAF